MHVRWLPDCAQLFVTNKPAWQYLVPDNDVDSTELVQEFFSSVALLMSMQLRSAVVESLNEFLEFVKIHKVH